MKDENWNENIIAISKIVENEEKDQRELGKRLSFLSRTYADGYLRKNIYERLLSEIFDMTGRKPSYSKLRQSKLIYERSVEYGLAEDIPAYVILKVTADKRKDDWVKMLHDGVAYGEVLKLLKESKDKPKKMFECPHCHQLSEI